MHPNSEENVLENCLVGLIVAFRNVLSSVPGQPKRKPERKPYTKDIASTSGEVEVLSSWYVCSNDGIMEAKQDYNHFFIHINQYIGTYPHEKIRNSDKQLSITFDNLANVKRSLFEYMN